MRNSKPIICILGMHRSGSSLAAQVLAGNGLRTGRSRIGRSRFNTEGHLEDRMVVRTNKKLLLYFGATWDRPLALPDDWLHEPIVRRLLQQVQRYERHEVTPRLPFFFKDPRTSLLVPFWREALGPMRYMVVLRNPDSVVSSVLRRQREWLQPKRIGWRLARAVYHRIQGAYEPLRSLDADQARSLWHHYYDRIVESMSGFSPTILVYERLLNAPQTETRRILRELGISKTRVTTDMVKPGLSHSRDTTGSPEVLEIQRRLLGT